MQIWRPLLLSFVLLVSEAGVHAADKLPSDLRIESSLKQAEKLQENGKSAQAQELYKALVASLSRKGPSSQLGLALNALSKIEASQGNYQEAIRLARDSADVYNRVGDGDGQSHALNNRAIAEIQNGDYTAARGDLEEALRLSVAGQDEENQVQILNNLGSAYYFPGSYSEASQSYAQAAEIVARNPSASWNKYWQQITQVNQATLLQKLGRTEQALAIYQQVEQVPAGLTSGDRAHLYANVGALYRRLGDPHKALDTYLKAQGLYAKEHDSDGEIAVLKNIGIAYALDLNDLDHAQQAFLRALGLAQSTHNRREEMQTHLYLAETLLRAHSVARAREEFQRSNLIATQLGTLEEQWKSLYGLGRIESLSGNTDSAETYFRKSIAIIEQTRSQLPLSALKAEFFADKREAYDALLSLLMKRQDATQAFEVLERSRARSFQDRLLGSNPPSTGQAVRLEEAQKLLDDHTLLLEYWTAPQQVGVIWCTRHGFGISLRELSKPDEASIQNLLDRLPESMDSFDNQQSPLSFLLPAASSLPAGIRHLLVVPDGWVSYVPFDLIRTQDNSREMLIERYDISWMPSAVLLRRQSPQGPAIQFPWSPQLVAFGDPILGTRAPLDAHNDLESSEPQRLPFSGEEIRGIQQMIHGKAEVLLQNSDLKRYFFDGRANSAALLHVSTHAFADVDNPENSRLLFSSNSQGDTPDYVFLRELYNLNLSYVRMATLSACDTARGKMIRGEGVQAFSRALLSAGAGSSVTSLWRVDDRSTAEFMRQFYYFALRGDISKAEALRLTKLKFLRSATQLNDPRRWAAFVLSGDGLTPLPRFLSWTTLVLGGIGTITAIVLPVVLVHSRNKRRIHRQNNGRGIITA